MGDVATRISGTWYNQLGSRLELHADSTGRLSGTFHSGVGGAAVPCAVTGSFDPAPHHEVSVVGFVVLWPDAHAVTVWSGHYHPDEDVITAMWLLAGECNDQGEWRSTHVGHDLFSRTAVTDAKHAAGSRASSASHPRAGVAL